MLADYEKTTGIFCPGHFPTDPEKMREFRLKKAEVKAQRYEEWAEKRKTRAETVFKQNERFFGDIAFNTQPGHIPFRARLIAANDRACESLQIANRMESKADNLRNVRVKGDAARRDEEKRAKVMEWIKPGMMVFTYCFGNVEILKVNKKTATVKGKFSNFTYDLIFMERPA